MGRWGSALPKAWPLRALSRRPPHGVDRVPSIALKYQRPSTASCAMISPDCPKFRRCKAPVCPLDPHMLHGAHLKGEPVCFYLLEYVKPGAKLRFQGSTAKKLYQRIQIVHPKVIARYGPLRRALTRAAQTGPRMGKQPPRGEKTKDAALRTDNRPSLIERKVDRSSSEALWEINAR